MPFHRIWLLGVTAVVAAALTGSPAYGQNCYGGSSRMLDICPTGTTDTDYVTSGTYLNSTVNYNGVSYVFDIHYNSFDVFDASNPSTPVPLTADSVALPWVTSGEGSGFYLIPHLRHMATLDGFGYGIGSLYYAGWDFFKFKDNDIRFLAKGHNPRVSLKTYYYLNSALFWRGNPGASEVWAAGQKLDSQAINDSDASIYLYLVQNRSRTVTPETLTYQSMNRVRVPVGGAGDPAPYNSFVLGSGGRVTFFPYTVAGSPRLLASNGSQAVVLNVSNPAQLIPPPTMAMWTSSANPTLFSGPWAVDRAHAMLHVANRTTEKVYSYDISDPANPRLVTPPGGITWHTPIYASQVRPATIISAAGSVIAVGVGQYLGYIPVDTNGVPTGEALSPDDASPTQATYIYPMQCVHPTLHPGVMALSVFTTTATPKKTCVARGLYSWADVIVVDDACLSTVPVPRLTVSRDPNQDVGCSGGDATGYPGDTFTITNDSTGTWSNPVLTITPPADTGMQPIIVDPMPTTYPWVSPAIGPVGQWGFDLRVTDDAGNPFDARLQSPPGNKAINLCGAPLAKVEITAVNGVACSGASCTYLTTDTVRFSAAPPISQGSPTSYFWFVNEALQLGNLATFELTLAQGQTYNVAVAVRYGFAGSTASSCSLLAVPSSPEYTTCASLPAITAQPLSIGAISLSQTPQPPDAQYLISKPISLSAPYKLGAGYTADFSWALDSPTSPAASYTPTPATLTAGVTSESGNVLGTIPEATLTEGAHTIYLVASYHLGADPPVALSPQEASFTASTCTPPGTITSPSPADGASQVEGSVTFSWPAPTGSPPPTYIVERQLLNWSSIPGCSGISATTCTTSLPDGPYKWRVKSSNLCGTSVSGEWALTLTSSSPPPPPPSYRPTANFTFSPASPQVSQNIQFTDTSTNMSSGFAPVSWLWDFGDGLPPIIGAHTSTAQNPTFAYDTAKAYTVTLTATNSDGSSTTTRQVVVSVPCTATTLPTASFTYVSPARATQPVQFTDTSTGGPTSWSWSFGDGLPPIIGPHTSTAQNPTNTFANPGTYTVTLIATNCKGSTTVQQQVVVGSACDLTAPPPTPDFTWGPTGPYPDYPQQQQPFVGQPVTLTVADATTGSPTSWTWSSDAGSITVHSPSFTFTWAQAGDMNVTLTATNCNGTSGAVTKTVHINDDIRPVVADFSWSPSNPTTGEQVTFTAAEGLPYGNPDHFYWTFDDGSTQTGASVTYSFKCGGSRRVTLTASHGTTNGVTSKSVPVQGEMCGPESVMGVDAAKIQGLNDTNWRADVRIYNPSAFPSSITLQFLPVGANNVDPFTVGPYKPPLPPRGTLVLDDILQWVKTNFGQDFSKTALRFTYQNDDNVAPIVTIRTYNLRPDGSKYGQINPGVNVVPGTTPPVQWIAGLRNNGLTDGFRTNYSIVNLRGDPGGIGGITFTLFDEAGALLGSKTFGLAPFGYIQDSIKNLFGPSFENIGTFSLKVEVPTGGDVQVYASVMDNHTGDPVLIPATTLAGSPIYLPAMAHLAGEAGTVWRTDLQLTNPDTDAPHTWEIRYTPKGTGLSVIARSITLDPDKSSFIDDLVSWVYAESATPLPADAQTSGIVRIAPVDGTNVYPAVAARSYNLTAIGTFGQGMPALWAARGVSFPDPTRLVLTGMSSEDIARTNLGFVNLSETKGVNFVVSFYDDRGNVLNPPGTDGQPQPYTFAIGPGTWDQDKLENRFRNAFKVALPATLQAVTAEIRVTDGGPGFAYASVIDNMTGDPNFIPAQLTP